MPASAATLFAAFTAGALSTLSPCVLPLLPILIAGALGAHRLGVVALAAGLALSYTAVGVVVATFAFTAGFDPLLLQQAGAVLLLALGLVLVSTWLEGAFAARAAGIATAGNRLLAEIDARRLRGQFAVGLLLGVVWSPCVGPTLGAAITLASQGRDLVRAATTMAWFGLGAVAPLLALALLSREAMLKWRGGLMAAGKRGKRVLGASLIVVGMLVLTRANEVVERWLLDASPAWLVRWTTSV